MNDFEREINRDAAKAMKKLVKSIETDFKKKGHPSTWKFTNRKNTKLNLIPYLTEAVKKANEVREVMSKKDIFCYSEMMALLGYLEGGLEIAKQIEEFKK